MGHLIIDKILFVTSVIIITNRWDNVSSLEPSRFDPNIMDNIYVVVRFFLYYSQIFGLSPVLLRKKDGKNFFQPFWLGMLYSISLAAFLCFSFQFSYGNIEMFAENDSDIMFMHTVCKLVFGPICVGIIFISSALSARGLCNVINKLSEFDEVFQKNIAQMKYKWLKYIFMCFFMVSLGVCSAYFYNEDIVLRKVSERSLTLFEFVSFFVSWCLFDIVSWTFIVVICSFLYLVYKKFNQINAKLVSVLSDYDKSDLDFLEQPEKVFHITHIIQNGERLPTPFPTNSRDAKKGVIKKVKQIRHLHILLVKISQDLNRIFSTRILAVVGLNVVLLCFSSFLLILMLVTGRRDNVLVTAVIWVCVRFFPTCVLIAPFCLVTNEQFSIIAYFLLIAEKLDTAYGKGGKNTNPMADKTSALVHLYMSRVEDVELREELKIFSMQLNNRKLTFTTHGFFSLDGGTILSVVGAAFAYLVVLLQFHMTMSNLKQNDGNSTESKTHTDSM